MTGSPDGWEDILEPGEQILWQGQPDGAFRLDWGDAIPAATGLFGAGFSVFWAWDVFHRGHQMWVVGLIYFFVSLGMMVARPVGSWWMRRHSFYSLSNSRAFIASDYPLRGRVLRFWNIRPDSPVEFIEGDVQTVNFASETRRSLRGTSTTRQIGFEGIHDGRKVIGLMRAIQRGAE